MEIYFIFLFILFKYLIIFKFYNKLIIKFSFLLKTSKIKNNSNKIMFINKFQLKINY